MPSDEKVPYYKTDIFKFRVGYGIWFGVMAVLIVIALLWGNGDHWLSRDQLLNLLLIIFGGALGWFVGILISPHDDDQRVEFKKYLGALSAFLSGVIFTKIDYAVKADPSALLTNGTFVGRVLIFGSAFLLFVLFVYVGRRIWPWSEGVPKTDTSLKE